MDFPKLRFKELVDMRRRMDGTFTPQPLDRALSKMAERTGVGVATWKRLYEGSSSISLKTAYKAAQYFGTSIEYLLGLSDIKSPEVDVRRLKTEVEKLTKDYSTIKADRDLAMQYEKDAKAELSKTKKKLDAKIHYANNDSVTRQNLLRAIEHLATPVNPYWGGE